jgi:hypothetical protein
MRKTIAAAVVLLLGLTGCSCLRTLTGAPPFDPKNPRVYVVESKDRSGKAVVVDQDPIYFFREQGSKIQIRWQLQTPGYRFNTTKGIADIKPFYGPSGQVHSCQVDPGSKDQRTFVCVNENTASGLYKYTISVESTDGSTSPKPLDPMVGND